MKIVRCVRVPFSRNEGWLVEGERKGKKTNPPKSVNDSKLWTVCRSPSQMDYGSSRERRREYGACCGLAQLPSTIRRVGPGTLQVDVGAIR